MGEEILVVKREKGSDKVKFKVCNKEFNKWSHPSYEKVIAGKDYNLIAYLFYDLEHMGYPIEKSIEKFRKLQNKPELFFLE